MSKYEFHYLLTSVNGDNHSFYLRITETNDIMHTKFLAKYLAQNNILYMLTIATVVIIFNVITLEPVILIINPM